MKYGLDAMEARFEVVTVLDHRMLFTCCRVQPDTVPAGLYQYEVRHDDDMQGQPVQIGKHILVNHWGTLLSSKPIALEQNPISHASYRNIDSEADWNYEGYAMTVPDYMALHKTFIKPDPIGKIEYLGVNGAVGESVQYYDSQEFERDIKSENNSGTPMRVVLYRLKDGTVMPHEFIAELDPPICVSIVDYPHRQRVRTPGRHKEYIR